MPKPKNQPVHFEVEDPANAMRKTEDLVRRMFAVPKKEGTQRASANKGKRKGRKDG